MRKFILCLLSIALFSVRASTAEQIHPDNIDEKKKRTEDIGIWLPLSELYPSELANPRQVVFACGIRLNDAISGRVASPVTFGMQFPVYRFVKVDMFCKTGDLQLDIEGAVFGIFNQTKRDNTLINTEYYVGIPVTYAYDNWAHKVRVYHVSSHLGDEYLKTHKHARRYNKSYEAFDYSLSYMLTDSFRLYLRPGVIMHSDSEMRLKPLYVEYGMDVHLNKHIWKELYGQPFISMHFGNAQDTKWDIDATYAIGYEWGRIENLGRKARVTLEYHTGFSQEGQFSRKRDNYLQFSVSYGF